MSNVGRLTSAKDELMGEVVIWTWLLLEGVLLKLGILPRLDETLLNSLSSSKVIRLVIPITSSSSSPPMLSSEAMGSTRGTGLRLKKNDMIAITHNNILSIRDSCKQLYGIQCPRCRFLDTHERLLGVVLSKQTLLSPLSTFMTSLVCTVRKCASKCVSNVCSE